MKTHYILAAAAAAAAMVCATSANARIFTITYTGVVFQDIDPSGQFSPIFGNNLLGKSFTAVYVVDPSLGTNLSSGSSNDLSGGVQSGTSNPILSATVIIDGKSQSVQIGDYDIIHKQQSGVNEFKTEGSVNHNTFPGAIYNVLSSDIYNFGGNSFGTKLDAPMNYNPQPNDFTLQQLIFDRLLDDQGDQEIYAAISANVTNVTVAVPEPATWALTIVGLGMAGAAVRRGKRPATA